MTAALAQATSSRPAETTAVRATAGGAAIALGAATAIVARQAGLVGRPARWLSPTTWGIAGYLAFNTVGNLASSSGVERWAFGPVTAIASALAAFVALRTRCEAST